MFLKLQEQPGMDCWFLRGDLLNESKLFLKNKSGNISFLFSKRVFTKKY